MNVMERMKAAGYDPALAREVRGHGTMECEEVEVTVDIVSPYGWYNDDGGYKKAVLVKGVACVRYTDGMLKPTIGWYDPDEDSVSMYFEEEKVSFEYRLLPDSIRV